MFLHPCQSCSSARWQISRRDIGDKYDLGERRGIGAVTRATSPDGRWLAYSLWFRRRDRSCIILLDVTECGAFYAKFEADCPVTHLDFSNDRRLKTGDATLAVETHSVPEKPGEPPAVHFDFGREWITFMSRRVLWVPPEFREPHSCAIHDHGFVWADDDSSIQQVDFNPSMMDEAGGWPPAEALHNRWKRCHPIDNVLWNMLCWMASLP